MNIRGPVMNARSFTRLLCDCSFPSAYHVLLSAGDNLCDQCQLLFDLVSLLSFMLRCHWLVVESVAVTCILKEALSINALRACVYIYIRQLSSFRAPTLWFIDLTLTTGHIQYTFLSCNFFWTRKRTKHENTKVRHFRMVGMPTVTRRAKH